jgi:aerobic-type carbon monoxide dehydrogenase small subunit (CoxS/CutS family)
MPETITLLINGRSVTLPEGVMVSTAVALSGATVYRRSVTGERRAPLCGMGICFECRVTINGQPHERSCQILCRDGMDVRTDE